MSTLRHQPLEHSASADLVLLKRGKVRDVYALGNVLLIVATDRISCFDVVLPTPIPGKGRVLTQMSCFWFERLRDIIPNHFCTMDIGGVLGQSSELQAVAGRSMLVLKAEPLPVEAVVRGYLAGSAWKEYCQTGAVCGVKLPRGLGESQKLPEPIFTPATKAPEGSHDENISFARMVSLIGKELAREVRRASVCLYAEAASYAAQRGIIIADTKFEFGLVGDRLMLIDEVLTPDSSRFWPMATYGVSTSPPSFDKQYVRDYLVESGWNKQPPAPELPRQVVQRTSENYQKALRLLTDEDEYTGDIPGPEGAR